MDDVCLRQLYNVRFISTTMEIYQQKLKLVQELQEILADRTISQQQMHNFQYFRAFFLKLSNHDEYLNCLHWQQKSRLKALDYKQKCDQFRKLYNQVKERHKPIFIKRKAYYRKVNYEQKWYNCFLQCNKNSLKLYKQQSKNGEICKELTIMKLQVGKIVKKLNNFYGFRIIHHNKTYQLAFQSKYYCQRLHQKLISILLQDNNKILQNNQNTNAQALTSYEKYILSKEIANNKKNIEKVAQQFANQANKKYVLVKNIRNGKIEFRKQSNKLKISILLPKLETEEMIQSYLSFYGWNNFVDQFNITKKTGKNKYSSYLRLKKYNFMTYPRQAYLSIAHYNNCYGDEKNKEQSSSQDSLKLGNKSYTFIKTQKDGDYSKDIVRMYFNQLIEISQINDNHILMTIVHELDFKTNRIILSNLNASLYFFRDIQFFSNFCLQYKLRYHSAKIIQKQ